MKIVILGNGVAGIEAAIELRHRQPSWRVTIISEESDHFFSRTALMWVLCGQLSCRDIEPYERDLYRRLGFERIRRRATGLDLERRCVDLVGGERIPYDRLLIACGSAPRPAPWAGAELRGVGHFVTMQDLEWFEQELHGGPGAEPAPRADHHLAEAAHDSPYRRRAAAHREPGSRPRRPAVIGGGLIGVEAVEVLVAAGLAPRIFIREEWFWPVVLDAREARWISDRLAGHGVEVLVEHEIEAIDGDGGGNVSAVQSDRGRYDADLVVVCIGVIPNTAWLDGCPLERDAQGGLVVDAQLATSAPDVFAAGDCAAVPLQGGGHRVQQLWYTARDQGRIAGRRLAGQPARYEPKVAYNSAKLMDIEYTSVGDVSPRAGDDHWYFEESAKALRSSTRIVVERGRVIGLNLLGRRWDHSVMQCWIADGRSLAWVVAHLNDAAFDTELVPPLQIPRSARPSEEAAARPR